MSENIPSRPCGNILIFLEKHTPAKDNEIQIVIGFSLPEKSYAQHAVSFDEKVCLVGEGGAFQHNTITLPLKIPTPIQKMCARKKKIFFDLGQTILGILALAF